MTRRTLGFAVLAVIATLPGILLVGHLGGARWLARDLAEDPGISWTLVTEAADHRILRDFIAPGATRRMHQHADVTWHALTLVRGALMLTVEGEAPVLVSPGQSLTLPGGVMHTFTNVDTATATIIEVFGKASN